MNNNNYWTTYTDDNTALSSYKNTSYTGYCTFNIPYTSSFSLSSESIEYHQKMVRYHQEQIIKKQEELEKYNEN